MLAALLFLLAAPMLSLASVSIVVLAVVLVLDLLDHPNRPPPPPPPPLTVALLEAPPLVLEVEALLSHDGSKDETRCMVGNG